MIYPNVITPPNPHITIRKNDFFHGSTTVSVLDGMGKIIYSKTLFVDEDTKELSLNLGSFLPPGIYLVQLSGHQKYDPVKILVN